MWVTLRLVCTHLKGYTANYTNQLHTIMITLYAKPTCPFCAIVRDKLSALNLEFTELDINDPEHADALVKRGGKRMVPYLIDDAHNIEMYESGDIANYLDATYGSHN